jgi:predicted N-acetyltransferase YhbS
MAVELRPATAADAEACGHIIYEAFKGIGEQHGFPPDFPSVEVATRLAGLFIAHPAIFAVAAESGGRIVGSNFLHEQDSVYGVGPISVAPSLQAQGIGRVLMQAVLERGREARAIRLVQDAFNTRSFSLYASLGFAVREPLMLMHGTPKSQPIQGSTVRPLGAADVEGCSAICEAAHGVTRSNELRDALRLFTPFVVERSGRITGYLSAATLWPLNHGVAETEDDMKALLLGAGAASSEPLSFLLPVRQSDLLGWCLNEGIRVVKPMNLMSLGWYREPQGPYFPSVFY